jgi:hypothetical protein
VRAAVDLGETSPRCSTSLFVRNLLLQAEGQGVSLRTDISLLDDQFRAHAACERLTQVALRSQIKAIRTQLGDDKPITVSCNFGRMAARMGANPSASSPPAAA